jgi:hypothetical protein
MHHHGSRELWAGGVGLGGGRSSAVVARDGGILLRRRREADWTPSNQAVAGSSDLWTCPVNPHLMHIGCNIYLFIDLSVRVGVAIPILYDVQGLTCLTLVSLTATCVQ